MPARELAGAAAEARRIGVAQGAALPAPGQFRFRAKVDPWRGTARFAEWEDWGTIMLLTVRAVLLWWFLDTLRVPFRSGRLVTSVPVEIAIAAGLALWVGRGLWRFLCLRRVEFSPGSDEVRLTVFSLAGVRRSVFPRSRIVLRKHAVRLHAYGSGGSTKWDGHTLILYLDRQEAIALAVRQNEREIIEYRDLLPEPVASILHEHGGHIDADLVRLLWY